MKQRTFFDMTEEPVFTFTKSELLALRKGDFQFGFNIGAATALDATLDHVKEKDIRRLREMKDEMRTAQMQMEAACAVKH